MDTDIKLSKTELAALIVINFLSWRRGQIFGKSHIKDYAKNTSQKLRDALCEKTNFEQNLGPMMAVSFECYLQDSFIQISQRKVDYEDEVFNRFSIDMLYFLLEIDSYFTETKLYEFFSEQITIIFVEKEICVDTDTVNELVNELVLMHKDSFSQKSFFLQSGGETSLKFA